MATSSRRCCPPESFLTRVLALGDEAGGLQHVLQGHGVGVVAAEEIDGLLHVEVGLDAGGLEDDAYSLAEGGLLPGRIVAQDVDLAGASLEVTLEDFDGGGLAGAVGTEEGEDFARRHFEVDAADGLYVTVGLPEAADMYGSGGVIHQASQKTLGMVREGTGGCPGRRMYWREGKGEYRLSNGLHFQLDAFVNLNAVDHLKEIAGLGIARRDLTSA